AGDQGRDVIGCVEAVTTLGPWDNFQCKHYDAKLMPSEVLGEIGKVLYHTWKRHYSVPRFYYFVSPKGCGPKLRGLLQNPTELKTATMDSWAEKCEATITAGTLVRLEGSLKDWVDGFDFAKFRDVAPHELIETHRQTPYYATRFGGGLQRARVPVSVPENPSA